MNPLKRLLICWLRHDIEDIAWQVVGDAKEEEENDRREGRGDPD